MFSMKMTYLTIPYTDDNQLHPSTKVEHFDTMTNVISKGSNQIDSQMTTNKLKKNNDKTEMIPCGTNTNSAKVGNEVIIFFT